MEENNDCLIGGDSCGKICQCEISKQKKEINLYDWLIANDVIEWIKPLIERAGWRWRESDGKIYAQIKPSVVETPWHHVKSDYRLKCGLWHQIMFDLVGKVLPSGQRFVPSGCQNCFKVVLRPKTLVQLFALRDVQEEMNRSGFYPCKCGIERRESVHGLYGGYFYNVGLKDGLDCYHNVVKYVGENKYLSGLEPGKDIILKRGCTEYEHAIGDSDEWKVTDEQRHIEGLLNRYLIIDDIELTQPEKLVHHVHRRWIEWAWQNGDSTYAQFTGGKPLYPAYKTYHHLKVDEKGNIVESGGDK